MAAFTLSLQTILTSVAAGAIVTGGASMLHTQSRVSALEAQRADDVARLDRIENKIDKLLEHAGVVPSVVAKNDQPHNP